jgi:cytidine deaminase
MTNDELIAEARRHVGAFELADPMMTAGAVSAALETTDGSLYTGICLDLACGIGFCAEHSAIADMLKDRKTRIARIVAVDATRILSPCGRCREVMVQVDLGNFACEVILPSGVKPLAALLPEHWFFDGIG